MTDNPLLLVPLLPEGTSGRDALEKLDASNARFVALEGRSIKLISADAVRSATGLLTTARADTREGVKVTADPLRFGPPQWSAIERVLASTKSSFAMFTAPRGTIGMIAMGDLVTALSGESRSGGGTLLAADGSTIYKCEQCDPAEYADSQSCPNSSDHKMVPT